MPDTTSMNISLPEQMRDWVVAQTENGKYSNNSDYVRDLIRRDKARQEKIASLQAAINKGLASGEVENFDMETLIRRMEID